MRITKILFILVFAVACASGAHAALVFNADFADDGLYNTSWPMKSGEVVTVAIYVSNVPVPGLISMGFKLSYDAARLSVVSAAVDTANWPQGATANEPQPGEINLTGFRQLQGLAGNDIRLATVTFRCIAEGTSDLILLKYGDSYDGFVLDCIAPCVDPEVLDGDIGAGVTLTTIELPVAGDINGDGAVNLADAILVIQVIAQLPRGHVHANADIDGNGVIGIQEVLYILQKLAILR